MKITKAFLDRRTANLEREFREWGIHPGGDWQLVNDYAACYGGYLMTFENAKHQQNRFFLSGNRLPASAFEDYQQGLFDMMRALWLSDTARGALYKPAD